MNQKPVLKLDQSAAQSIAEDRVIEGHIQLSSVLRFCRFAFASKRVLVAGVLGLAVGAASWTATSWLSGHLADRLIFLSKTTTPFSQDATAKGLLAAAFAAVLAMYLGNRFGRLFINKSLIEAMQKIHDQALQGILGTSMLFFQRTSTGRILARFSSDFASASNAFDRIIATFVYAIFAMLFSVLFILFSKPMLILMSLPFCFILFYVSRYFGSRARDEQRLASRSNALSLGLFGEALGAVHLIRTFDVRAQFQNRLEALQNDASKQSYRALQTANVRSFVQALLALLMTLCAMFVAYQAVQAEELTLGEAGASVTLIMLILRNFLLVVELLTTLEAGFTSIERLNEYIELEAEETTGTSAHHAGAPIPRSQSFEQSLEQKFETDSEVMALRLQDLEVRYASDLPLVLKKICLRIKFKERVGIVGRTGSGKSTLVQALYRLLPLEPGQIFLAGNDITSLPLASLRRCLAIVPQDPVLFQASLLDNLCPKTLFSQASEAERIAAAMRSLEKVNLHAWVQGLPDGLQSQIEERGSNLSQGQKQLVCLARALATNPVLLILDEATSSVDPETEQLVTTAVHQATKEQTTIIIAHHLSTVESCDRILFMEDGQIVEDASPSELLADPNSRFAKLRAAALEKQSKLEIGENMLK